MVLRCFLRDSVISRTFLKTDPLLEKQTRRRAAEAVTSVGSAAGADKTLIENLIYSFKKHIHYPSDFKIEHTSAK